MLSEDGLFFEEVLFVDVDDFEEREDRLTPEEMFELTQLHEEAMIPTQEEEDWMLLIDLKKERKVLAHLYWPNQAHYKIEDICNICNRLFYKKGSIKTHIKKVHSEGLNIQNPKEIPQDILLTKSLPNLQELLETVPFNTLMTERDVLEFKKDVQQDNIFVYKEDKIDNVCELCDKVLPNKTQK